MGDIEGAKRFVFSSSNTSPLKNPQMTEIVREREEIREGAGFLYRLYCRLGFVREEENSMSLPTCHIQNYKEKILTSFCPKTRTSGKDMLLNQLIKKDSTKVL